MREDPVGLSSRSSSVTQIPVPSKLWSRPLTATSIVQLPHSSRVVWAWVAHTVGTLRHWVITTALPTSRTACGWVLLRYQHLRAQLLHSSPSHAKLYPPNKSATANLPTAAAVATVPQAIQISPLSRRVLVSSYGSVVVAMVGSAVAIPLLCAAVALWFPVLLLGMVVAMPVWLPCTLLVCVTRLALSAARKLRRRYATNTTTLSRRSASIRRNRQQQQQLLQL